MEVDRLAALRDLAGNCLRELHLLRIAFLELESRSPSWRGWRKATTAIERSSARLAAAATALAEEAERTLKEVS